MAATMEMYLWWEDIGQHTVVFAWVTRATYQLYINFEDGILAVSAGG